MVDHPPRTSADMTLVVTVPVVVLLGLGVGVTKVPWQQCSLLKDLTTLVRVWRLLPPGGWPLQMVGH